MQLLNMKTWEIYVLYRNITFVLVYQNICIYMCVYVRKRILFEVWKLKNTYVRKFNINIDLYFSVK